MSSGSKDGAKFEAASVSELMWMGLLVGAGGVRPRDSGPARELVEEEVRERVAGGAVELLEAVANHEMEAAAGGGRTDAHAERHPARRREPDLLRRLAVRELGDLGEPP